MRICGRHFTIPIIQTIQSKVDEEPTKSRRALSKEICALLDWKSPNGKLQEGGCRKALAELGRCGVLRLPECRCIGEKRERGSQEDAPIEAAQVECSLKALGNIEILQVGSSRSKSAKVWKGLMTSFHPLGNRLPCGPQIRYLVRSERYGWLGGLSFDGAAWRLKDRDEWIGWSDRARRSNLNRVVENGRFLIVPSVNVPHLASHVLGKATRRMEKDWEERYGVRPLLVETYVDMEKYKGTSYRAAGWEYVGMTAGQKGTRNWRGKQSSGKKAIYVFGLEKSFREELKQERAVEAAPRVDWREGEAHDWAEEEFGGVDLYDLRLRRRLDELARAFMDRPGKLLPEIYKGDEAGAKAAYRFFSNRQVSMQKLLEGHYGTSVERMRKHKVVLAVQDTTELNYATHVETEGLGPIGTKKDGAQGLIVHDTMAFTDQGVPLGLVDVQCWAREGTGKREKRKELPIEQKESMKWLRSYRAASRLQETLDDSMVVSIGDRESDIYELFLDAEEHERGAQLLVRADKARQRKAYQSEEEGGEAEYLWPLLLKERAVADYVVKVSKKGTLPKRDARVEVRYKEVTLKSPTQRPDLKKKVRVWAVHVVEIGYGPEVNEPLDWMLLTTVPVRTTEEALERVQWYTRRWCIEVYHKTLKSGCRIEDRQLGTADRLEACLALDMVVAWRINWLVKVGREMPEMDCTEHFSEEEWQVVWVAKKKGPLPKKPPSMRTMIRMVAALGGFLGRKNDGEPGATTLWRGLVYLESMLFGWRACQAYYQGGGPPDEPE
jgi:hypothetical protein